MGPGGAVGGAERTGWTWEEGDSRVLAWLFRSSHQTALPFPGRDSTGDDRVGGGWCRTSPGVVFRV